MNALASIGLTFLRDVLAMLREASSSGDSGASAARSFLVRFDINSSPVIAADKVSLFRFCASIACRCFREMGILVTYPNMLPYQMMMSIMNQLSSQYRVAGDICLDSIKTELIGNDAQFMPTPVRVTHAIPGCAGMVFANQVMDQFASFQISGNSFELYAPFDRRGTFSIREVDVVELRFSHVSARMVETEVGGAVVGRRWRTGTVSVNNVAMHTGTWHTVRSLNGEINVVLVPNANAAGDGYQGGSWMRMDTRSGYGVGHIVDKLSIRSAADLLGLLSLIAQAGEVSEFINCIFGQGVNDRLDRVLHLDIRQMNLISEIIMSVVGIAQALNFPIAQ